MINKKKKYKMLTIIKDKYPPFRVDVNILLAEKLSGIGYSIDWLVQSKKEIPKNKKESWGDGYAYITKTDNGNKVYNRIKKNLSDFINDCRVIKLSKKKSYDFVIVRDKFISALIAIYAAKRYNSKFIYWLSYPFPEADLYQVKERSARHPLLYLVRGYLRKFILYNFIFPLSDHIFVQTEYMKNNIKKIIRINDSKMTAVPMGFDAEKIIKSKNHKIKKNDGSKLIVYLGTLARVRKLGILIRSFSIIKKKYENSKLIFVGCGEDKNDEEILYSEIKKYNIENDVIITGMLPQEEAWNFVKMADVCVSPIYPSEILKCGSPTKLIEYMALSKAIVANDHPEQKQLIKESKSGIIVQWDEKEFADAICKILGDENLAMIFSKRGSKYIFKNRTYDKLALIVHNKLEQVVQRS